MRNISIIKKATKMAIRQVKKGTLLFAIRTHTGFHEDMIIRQKVAAVQQEFHERCHTQYRGERMGRLIQRRRE
jgi:hypothetical protein